MGQMEHLLNVYASKSARNSIANFLGYVQVMPSQASRTLTQGLWLVSSHSQSSSPKLPMLGHLLRTTFLLRNKTYSKHEQTCNGGMPSTLLAASM